MEKRKSYRLPTYLYCQNGAYFITICVKDRLPILSEICFPAVGAGIARPITEVPQQLKLTAIGAIVDQAIQAIPAHYLNIAVDHYIIMPDHVHLLLRIDDKDGRAMPAPTAISKVIQQLKGFVTKQCGKVIWQKSFYDHIIRTEQDYCDIWRYIDENPAKWREQLAHSAKGTANK